MKIPKRINIFGFKYVVKHIEPTEIMKENNWVATVNNMQQEIVVSKGLSEQATIQSLLHEIVHAIDFITNGSGDYSLTEQQTDKVAYGIASVLLNNEVDKWL